MTYVSSVDYLDNKLLDKTFIEFVNILTLMYVFIDSLQSQCQLTPGQYI